MQTLRRPMFRNIAREYSRISRSRQHSSTSAPRRHTQSAVPRSVDRSFNPELQIPAAIVSPRTSSANRRWFATGATGSRSDRTWTAHLQSRATPSTFARTRCIHRSADQPSEAPDDTRQATDTRARRCAKCEALAPEDRHADRRCSAADVLAAPASSVATRRTRAAALV